MGGINKSRILRKLVSKYILPNAQTCYSQFGEDIIINHLFNQLDILKPSYLDIGANQPKYISNTYLFYEKGSRGVLLEPNPHLFNKLKKQRPNDIVINSGVGISEVAEADFYVFPDYANGLSTFSEKEAQHWQQTGMKGYGKIPVEKIIKMPLTPINTLLQKYFSEKSPNIISIDVEGLDLDILRSMDFIKYQPEVICVETLLYDDRQKGYKNKDIIDFMLSKNYIIYADTRVNTIFCRNDIANK